MAGEFDPLRAAREQLSGLNDVLVAMRRRERSAEAVMAQAESELTAIRKLRGYTQGEVATMVERIRKLERTAEEAIKPPTPPKPDDFNI